MAKKTKEGSDPFVVEKVAVGATVRIYCNDCTTEFEILHEPLYTDPEMAKGFGGKAKAPKICPFCGTDENLEVTA